MSATTDHKWELLAPREWSEDEIALAIALDKAGVAMLSMVDKSCYLRSAPDAARRQRAIMKTNLEQALSAGMAALAHSNHQHKMKGN